MKRIKTHSLAKLIYLEKYINAYLSATKRLPKKFYFDAFAGTGQCIVCDNSKCSSKGGKRCQECGNGSSKIVDGSVFKALQAKYQFDKYFFIELSLKNYAILKNKIIDKINNKIIKKIVLKCGDSNQELINIINNTKIDRYTGCFLFLDPEGPELFWKTIIDIAGIPKAELLILYPYDMSLVRLTTTYGIKLDNFFGSLDWAKISRNATSAEDRRLKLLNFYRNNLQKLGFQYTTAKRISKVVRSGKLLYYLIYATHNPAGIKIMKNVFEKELDGQTKMKF